MINTQPRSKYLVHAGWLVDGTGSPVKRDQILQIDAGVIRSVSPLDGTAPPPDMVEDLSHATLLPVLMDAHVHLALSGTLDVDARHEQQHAPPEQTQTAIHRHLLQLRANGVGAVRDAGDRHGAVLKTKHGKRWHDDYPYVSATCWAWHGEERYGRLLGRSPDPGLSLQEDLARRLGASDHIKLINSGINSLDQFAQTSRPHFSEDQLQAIAQHAQDNQLPLMVHANGAQSAGGAIAAGCDSIEHGYFMNGDNLRKMADKQIFWVPTLAPMAVLAEQCVVTRSQADVARKILDQQMEQISLGLQYGVKVALGTDAGSGGVDHGIAVRKEIALLMTSGLSLTQAVCCATLNVAKLMRLDNRGALIPRYKADMIAVNAGPDKLPDALAHISAMCVDGRWVDLSD